MESLSYLHLEAASQEPSVQNQQNLGNSWNSEAWDEIFEEIEEEDDTATD